MLDGLTMHMRMDTAATRKPFWSRKLPVTRLQALGIVAVLYLIGYFALMNRRSPAISYHKGVYYVSFHSSFRFASMEDGCPTATFWNAFFYPLDKIYFGVFPSHRKYGDWKDVSGVVPH